MIKQLVSNIDFLPSNRQLSTVLFTSRTTPPHHHAWVHTRGGGWSYILSVSHWWQFTDCTHSEKMMISIISWWDFIFHMTYTPDVVEANRIGKTRPHVCLKGNGDWNIEFKDFDLEFPQSTYLCATFKCIEFFHKIWDSVYKIWDSVHNVWDSVHNVWDSVHNVWDSVHNVWDPLKFTACIGYVRGGCTRALESLW